MIEDILSIYMSECHGRYRKYGFKTYKKSLYRVINDIFQGFTIQRSVSGEKCQIEFGVIPLCTWDTIRKDSVRPYYVTEFEDTVEWFYYDRKSADSVIECVNQMIRYIDKYLIPHFESSKAPESAYKTVDDFCKKHIKYEYSGAFDLFCFALKSKQKQVALRQLRILTQMTENALQDRIDNNQNISQEFKERCRKKTSLYERLRDRISADDFTFINSFILENENNNRRSLGINEIKSY